jgi:hypothetical protein
MTTLEEAYAEYIKKESHGTIIEMRCLKTGCEGDIYRSKIAGLEKRIEQDHDNYADWQHRAEKAESQLQAIVDALKSNMIFNPIDNWQWGYRSGLLSVLDVIKPKGK